MAKRGVFGCRQTRDKQTDRFKIARGQEAPLLDDPHTVRLAVTPLAPFANCKLQDRQFTDRHTKYLAIATYKLVNKLYILPWSREHQLPRARAIIMPSSKQP